MKVLRIIARLNVGGPAQHVVWLTAGMRSLGHQCELIAGTVPTGEDDMSRFATAHGVEPIVIPEMSREISIRDAVAVWKLYRLLCRLRPNIVHTHTAKAGTIGRVAGMFYRWLVPGSLIGRPRSCRFVHTYHGHVFHSYYGRWKTLFFLSIERFLARVATDQIVVISPQQYHEIHDRYCVGRGAQFRIIPLGLDLEPFVNWRERRSAARGEFGASDAEILVGIVGRLTEIKNHQLFLRAIVRYKEERARATTRSNIRNDARSAPILNAARLRFVIIGDGHLRRELEGEVRALGLIEDVVFTGSRGDAPNFYAALDVVALTSLNEGTPLTLIEAMANARPVVATAVGGVVDLLGQPDLAHQNANDEGFQVCERGILVRPNDEVAFARALMRLTDDVDLRRRISEQGQQFVEQHYGVDRLLADMMNLYEETLTAKKIVHEGERTATTEVQASS